VSVQAWVLCMCIYVFYRLAGFLVPYYLCVLYLVYLVYIPPPYLPVVSCDAFIYFSPPFCVPGNRPRGRKGFGCVQIVSSEDWLTFAFVSVYLLEAE
jgi:hypothetical protein